MSEESVKEKSLKQVVEELSRKNSAYKFAVYGGQAVIQVDGFMKTLSFR